MELVSFMAGLECCRENPCCLFDSARTYTVFCKLSTIEPPHLLENVSSPDGSFHSSATKNMIQTILPVYIYIYLYIYLYLYLYLYLYIYIYICTFKKIDNLNKLQTFHPTTNRTLFPCHARDLHHLTKLFTL